MAAIKVIITGATGMVGEGVLFECLQNSLVDKVLMVNRRHYDLQHPKLTELIASDFFKLDNFKDQLTGFDACFFCAGISSVGMKENKYTHITYDTTLAFAKTLLALNPQMTFTYVSGAGTDSSENGRLMWARVKGKTENDLAKLGFTGEYNFRPGVMLPFPGQKNWKSIYKFIAKVIKTFSPKSVLTMQEVGKSMIHVASKGFSKNVLEVKAIKELALG